MRARKKHALRTSNIIDYIDISQSGILTCRTKSITDQRNCLPELNLCNFGGGIETLK